MFIISGGRGIVALTDGRRMYINKAWIAEIRDNRPVFVYQFDPEVQEDVEFNVILAMKANKAIAYIAGHKQADCSGYIRCKSKKQLEDDEGDPHVADSSNRFLCGIF